MDSFEKREKSYEGKFAHDQELKFKISAKRDRSLALWAASKMYLEPDATEKYIQEVIDSDLHKPGSDDVLQKVYGDLKKAGAHISENEIRHKMLEFQKEAERELKG